MARQIANYQQLQDAVASYLNRTDLVDRIPQFIYFGERDIFRWFRQQANEQLQTIDMRVDPDTGDPDQVSLSARIDLPEDYLETLSLQANGVVLERISLSEFQQQRGRLSGGAPREVGEPRQFARQRDSLILTPAPTGDTYITWIYYCDLSGRFDAPNDDNAVLRIAPDLYVFAALLHAEPYLKPEDDGLARIALWRQMYEQAKQALIEQNDMEAYSGSVNEVQSGFVSGFRGRSGPNDRRGWA